MEISKKRMFGLSLFLVMAIASVGAYVIITTKVFITVKESISLSPAEIQVEIYPKQSLWYDITVSNANPDNATEVTLKYVLTPATPELTIDFVPKDVVVVPAAGSATVKLRIRASKSIDVSTFTLTITWER